jgi:hypothetical protein
VRTARHRGLRGGEQARAARGRGQSVSCGPSPERHLEAIDRFIKAGYDHIILLQVGPDQDAFFDLFERELAPALRARGGVTNGGAAGRGPGTA